METNKMYVKYKYKLLNITSFYIINNTSFIKSIQPYPI